MWSEENFIIEANASSINMVSYSFCSYVRNTMVYNSPTPSTFSLLRCFDLLHIPWLFRALSSPCDLAEMPLSIFLSG